MRFPSKITPYHDSLLSKFPIILDILQDGDISVDDLFEKMRTIQLSEFILILDCLFALGQITYIKSTGRICYVVQDI